MKNPLFEKVRLIALRETRNSQIRNTAFESIRNQSSVRAAMMELGYVPNNPVRADYWYLPLSYTREAKAVKIKKPRKPQALMTYRASLVLDELKKNKVFYANAFEGSKTYRANIMHELRTLGYSITSNRVGREVVSYELIEHKKP